MDLISAQIEFDDQGRLVSTAYGDIYFQPGQAVSESEYVFLHKGGFYEAIESGTDVTVAELGFGTGLNFLLSAKAFVEKANPGETLHYIAFEKHPIRAADLKKIHGYWPELSTVSDPLRDQYPLLTQGIHRLHFKVADRNINLTLVWGDVSDWLPDMPFQADIWYLDGFAPAKNPDMWADLLWKPIARNTKDGGRVTTFTAAGAVRRGLITAGFDMEKTRGYGRKRDMLIGTIQQNAPRNPMPYDAKSMPWPHVDGLKKVAVIGAGIAGCALADALTRHGIETHIYDTGDGPAGGASGNPVAAVYPKLGVITSPSDRLYRQAFTYARMFYGQLPDSSFDACGVFLMDRNTDAQTRHQKISERIADPALARYVETDSVTGLDLKQGGLWMEQGGTVCPPDLCRALIKRAHQTGRLHTHYNHKVTDLAHLGADAVILANADGINTFAETDHVPVEAVRGQISRWPATPVSQHLKSVLCHKGYITPCKDGAHIIGATFDKGASADHIATAADHTRNLEQLFAEVPELRADTDATRLAGRRAHRTASPDRLPYCGPVLNSNEFEHTHEALSQDATTRFDRLPPYHTGLYILGALGSHGMTTAPWLAEVLACHLAGVPLPASSRHLYDLTPARMAVRQMIRKNPS